MSGVFGTSDTETTYLHKGEVLVVFLLAYFIAVSMWLLINMGKEYNLTIEVPLHITDYGDEMTFAVPPPDMATIGVSGEGWNLLPLYRNPPEIIIPYRDGELNINNLVQSHLAAYSEVNVVNVDPSFITLKMEQETGKKVPVSPDLDVQLRAQHEIIGDIRLSPDSVMVYGAKSVIDTLRSLSTETLRLRNVQNGVDQLVPLVPPEGIRIRDTQNVRIAFDVTELTEGEARIQVQARNVPEGREIRFTPAVISVRYYVPIDYFIWTRERTPYEAYVDYSEILRDTTGYVVPRVEPVTDELNLRLRSFQPSRIAYFHVISD